MNRVDLPPLKPDDDLDGLLRAFFRSQMPARWPAPPRLRTAPLSRPTPPRRPLMRSRWVLAASAALLLLGSLALPGRLAPSVKHDRGFDGPMTGDTRERKHLKDEQKIREFEEKHPAGLGADDGQFPDLDDSDMSHLK